MKSRSVFILSFSAVAGVGLLVLAIIAFASAASVPDASRAVQRSVDFPSNISTGNDVAQALSELPSDPFAGAASEVRETIRAELSRAIPTGSTIRADPRSWVAFDDTSGTIEMTMFVPGEDTPRAYIGVVIWEQGAWRLLATLPGGE